jgi:hypothetical protein
MLVHPEHDNRYAGLGTGIKVRRQGIGVQFQTAAIFLCSALTRPALYCSVNSGA